MADLTDTIVHGDLTVLGKINGASGNIGGGGSGVVSTVDDLGLATVATSNTVDGTEFRYATTANTAAANIVTMEFDGLKYGTYAIMLRMALSNVTSANALIKLEAYHVVGTTETLLNAATIKPTDLVTANAYDVVGFNTKFRGAYGTSDPKLVLKISILSNSVANTMILDYIRVAPAFTTIYTLPTT
jgi:hypothetical protein